MIGGRGLEGLWIHNLGKEKVTGKPLAVSVQVMNF